MFFVNPGKALKIIAVILLLCGVAMSFIIAFNIFNSYSNRTTRIIIIIGGSFFSLIGSEFLWAFGCLCEDVERIVDQQRVGNKPPLNQSKSETSILAPVNQKWKCPECGNMNDSFAVTCSKCRYQK